MTKATTMTGVGLIAAVTVSAGCGGSGGAEQSEDQRPTPNGQPGAAQQAPVATIDVRETESKLDPANPRIDKPGVVEFRVENAGQTVPALEVEGPEGEVGDGGDSAAQVRQPQAKLTEPGEYVVLPR